MTDRWYCTTTDTPWQARELPDTTDATPDLVVTGDRRQTVLGLGGCFNEAGWDALSDLPADQRDGVLDDLFVDLGFDYCRVPIGASDYALQWYSHDEHDGDLALEHFSVERDERYVLPYIRAARERRDDRGGLRLFASPWSPPTWMKSPKAYNHGRLRDEPEVLDAYARYLLKFVQAYRERGVEVGQVHVQNEPYSDQKFPSCVMPPRQMAAFIREHLGPTFAAAGEDCEIWAGTFEKGIVHGWDLDPAHQYPHLAHDLLRDPAVREHVAGVGVQWDGKGIVARLHHAFPDLPIVQTENECGDGQNTWAYAFYVLDLIWHYFSNGCVAYVYWNMVLRAGGVSTWGWKQNSMVCVDAGRAVRNPEFYVMKHLAHAARRGSTRLATSGVWSAFALAFDDGDATRVLLFNPYDTDEAVTIEAAGTTRTFALPARSVHTLIL